MQKRPILPLFMGKLEVRSFINYVFIPSLVIGAVYFTNTTISFIICCALAFVIYIALAGIANMAGTLFASTVKVIYVIYITFLLNGNNRITTLQFSTILICAVLTIIIIRFICYVYYYKVASKISRIKEAEIENSMDYIVMRYSDGVKYKD